MLILFSVVADKRTTKSMKYNSYSACTVSGATYTTLKPKKKIADESGTLTNQRGGKLDAIKIMLNKT